MVFSCFSSAHAVEIIIWEIVELTGTCTRMKIHSKLPDND